MLQYLQWVRLLSFTWCLLFGETSGDIYGRQKEIPGIIYKNKGRKFLQPLSHKKQKCLSDRTEKDCSILSF
jgi:hypothetical protein